MDSVLSILGQAHSSAMAIEGEDIGDDEQVQVHFTHNLFFIISLDHWLRGFP